MDTFSVLTLQLARVWGVAALILAFAALFTSQRMSAVMADFERSPGLTFLAALFALILGLVQVMFHNLWTDPLAILVSLIGWLAIVKGIVLLALPEPIMKLVNAGASASRVRAYGVAILILAIILLALGLGGHATASA